MSERIKTYEHIRAVQQNMVTFATYLLERALVHDNTKLQEPEASVFEAATPRLATLTYNSPEYKEALKELGPALEHHYKHNTHHPEHFAEGMSGFNLLDLVEMFCDWAAATERHDNGSLCRSIDVNKERFGYDQVLHSIFQNSRRLMPARKD